MNAKRLSITVGALAVIAVVIFGVILVNSAAPSGSSAKDGASSSASSSTLAGSGLTSAPQASAISTPAPTASAAAMPTVSPDGAVPVVAPSLKAFDMSGIGGYSPAMEANLSAEEIQARSTIYRVLPVLLNRASHKYTSPAGARDELARQNLITQSFADKYFSPNFSNFQSALNKAGYTVQTTGMQCFMRGQSAQTALQLGQVTCYYSRQYLDLHGNFVGVNRYMAEVGGAGAIDPIQEQRSIFYMKNDGGVWKVDSVQLQAH